MAFAQGWGGSVLSLITQLEAISEQTRRMEYSISEAGKHTGRSADTVRRAIRAGKLKAAKHPTAGYRITDTDLKAWASRPLVSQNLIAVDGLEVARAELKAARAELDTARAELEVARRELDTEQIENGHLKELLEVQADQLTRERQSADAAHESQRLLTAALGVLNNQLKALETEKPRWAWFRQRSTESRPSAER
jgi:excisionase family DNA binding protein